MSEPINVMLDNILLSINRIRQNIERQQQQHGVKKSIVGQDVDDDDNGDNWPSLNKLFY